MRSLAVAILAAFSAALLCAAPARREVDVVVDMTPAGRKLAHPSAAHPAFYLPVVGGYKEMGATVAGEVPPQPRDVVHLVAVELAKQGYFVINQQHRAPDIILSLHWGYLNPEIENMGSDPSDATGRVFFNQNQMLGLVAGGTLGNLDLDFEREDVMQAAEDNRYFVALTAYEATAYFRTRKKVMLWQAKMSVPSNGVNFPDVLTALVKAGGPFLGRETKRPKMLLAPVLPDGKVEVGTPTVKDYFDAPPPAPSAQPPPKR